MLFLQNHDQTGNRAHGDRLTTLAPSADRLRAAVALQLLAPQVPLIFMGEEIGSQAPFLYFTSHADPALADAVREGRQREFASFAEFGDTDAVPDPNAQATYTRSQPWADEDLDDAQAWLTYYEALLQLRQRLLAPRLRGASSLGARGLGDHAVQARWALNDGAVLTLYANLGQARIPLPADLAPAGGFADLLFESLPGAFDAIVSGSLCGASAVYLLQEAP